MVESFGEATFSFERGCLRLQLTLEQARGDGDEHQGAVRQNLTVTS